MSNDLNRSIPMLRKHLGLHERLTEISAIVLLVCAGCSSNAEKPAPPPPIVTVTPVIQKEVPVTQEWVGTMAGNTDAEIRPKVEGFLLTRLYDEGSYVDKGQAIFSLIGARPKPPWSRREEILSVPKLRWDKLRLMCGASRRWSHRGRLVKPSSIRRPVPRKPRRHRSMPTKPPWTTQN